MKLRIVHSDRAPEAIGPYAQGLHLPGGLVFCSGQIPLDPATGTVVGEDAESQTRQVLRNLGAVLEAAGASLAAVVKTTVFLLDMEDFPAMNRAYAEAFGEHRPARAAVQVARLPKDVRVEIEAVAWLGEGEGTGS